MAITVTLLDVESRANQFECAASFVDEGQGIATKERLRGSDLNAIKVAARRRVAELTPGGTDMLKEIAAVLNQPLNLNPPDPPEPTPLQSFIADVAILRSMQRGIDLKILDAGLKLYTDQLAKVAASLAGNPEWVSSL